MGLRQHFRFKYKSVSEVRTFLNSWNKDLNVEDKGEFLVFTPISGDAFTFDCEILPSGLLSDRDGNYFAFLGKFVEALTGHFGPVQIEDA